MKPYKPLLNYLERFTVFKVGRLHIRIHHIKQADILPFQHTHPFNYMSIILRGGYTEQQRFKSITHTVGSVIFRSHKTPHRLSVVDPSTVTLFVAWNTKEHLWEFQDYSNHADNWTTHPVGVYSRELYGKRLFSKFDKYWHKSSNTVNGALEQKHPSIDQNTKGIFVQPC